MRSFYAIELDDKTRSLLSGIQNKLKGEGVTGNYSFPENLHLTIKFLGEINDRQFIQARDLLQHVVQKFKPFVLSLQTLGKFSKGSKHILWAGLEHEEQLFALNREVETGLKAFLPGIVDGKFSPHITLVREATFNRQIDFSTVLNDETGHSFSVQGLSLMESTRVNGRLTYIRRAYEPFKNRMSD